jgi:hypothetical protein
MISGRRGVSLIAATMGITVSGSPPAWAATAPEASPAPSPFVQCDGRKGHVGTLGVLGQLVAITATAGLAGDAFNKDDGDLTKRLNGRPGASACDLAITAETDPVRRTQLGLARTIHLVEADDLPGALESVNAVPALAPTMANDWAFQLSLGSSTLFLKAVILGRMGRAEEAEDAAMQSAALAPYDLVAMYRVPHYAQLTPRKTPAKIAFLEHLVRLYPVHLGLRAELNGWWGDYKAAARDKADQAEMLLQFRDPGTGNVSNLLAQEALFLLMAGDKTRSDSVAAQARKELDRLLSEGGARTDSAAVYEAQEGLDFLSVVQMAAAGQIAKARIAYAARSSWLNVPPPVVADTLARLQVGMTAAERVGPLMRDPEDLRRDTFKANLALLKLPVIVRKLYGQVKNTAKITDYSRLSAGTWKITGVPRFMMRNPKDVAPGVEIIDTNIMQAGLAGGEAVLLQAALIARSRGKSGFITPAERHYLPGSQVLFGNIGEPNFPRSATFPVDETITALSQHIPPPAVQ